MKKVLCLFLVFFTVSFYSQFINVASSSPQQLANKIVNTNCVTTSNWSVNSGSTSPGNPASSIGSFTNTNPNFPFANGIIMSTGSITNVQGPKVPTNGDGNLGWAGDADMNVALGASNFLNASSIQFNFTSTVSAFNFNYVFASDEYGNNQCTSGDGIVILLTNLATGVTQNLAKIPVVNQNVSVATIRKNIFNTTCGDVNPSFFSTFYSGLDTANAPINFLGQTVLMTASATLIPNQQYRLKIVIADTNDGQNDSALFMNYAPVILDDPNRLGPDISSTNNTALCNGNQGNTYTLSTGLPATYTYVWEKDGIVVSGQNGPNYLIPASETFGVHTYKVTYLTGICSVFDGKRDSVLIEFLPIPIVNDPITLYKCIGDTSYNFQNMTNIITKDLSFNPIISYYLTNNQAQIGSVSNALPISYSGTATTIFVRIVDVGNSCPIIRQFNLATQSSTIIAISPTIAPLCSITSTDQRASVNLNTLLDSEVLGTTQSPLIYQVTYHTTLLGSLTSSDLIVKNLNGFSLISTSIIHVRVSLKSNPLCFNTTTVSIIVNLRKLADKPEKNIVYCGNPGYYSLPPLINGSYFLKKYDKDIVNSQGAPIPAGTLIPSALIPSLTPNVTETFFVYVSNLITSPGECSQEWELKITLIRPSIFKETSKTVCDEYPLPNLDYGNYVNVTTGAIIPKGTTLTATTLLGYLFESEASASNPSCIVNAGPVTITIENKPDLGPLRENLFVCNTPYILPSLSAYPGAKYYTDFGGPSGLGVEITNLDITADLLTNGFKKVYAYKQGTGTLMCPNDDGFTVVLGIQPILVPPSCNYTLQTPNIGDYFTGPGGTGIKLIPPLDYVIEQTTTLYLYTPIPAGVVCNPAFVNEVSFTVTVSQPTIDNIPNFTIVDGERQVTSCGKFTLPIITNGKYYTDSHYGLDPTGGTQLLGGVAKITSNQTIYIYDEIIDNSGPTPVICSFEKKFNIVIYPEVLLDNVNTSPILCGVQFYDLPVLTYGNYYTGTMGTGQLLDTAALRKIQASTTPVTVYAYNTDTVNNCPSKEATIVLAFLNVSVDYPLADATNNIIERCTSYTLPSPINGKFYEGPGGPQGTAILPAPANGVQIPNGTNLTIPASTTINFYDKQIYIYNSFLVGVREYCPTDDSKVTRIILYKEPKITTVLNDMYFCGSTPITGADLPTLSGPNISANLPAKYYTQSHLAGGTGGTEITPTTVLTNGQTVYAYVKNESIVANSIFAGCFDEKSFKVNIFKVDTGSNIDSCGSQSLAALPTLTVGGYYTNSTGTSPLSQTDLENTTTIPIVRTVYIYASSGFPAGKCQSDFSTFTITINPVPVTFPVALVDRTFCDEFDNQNDGIYNVALSQYDATIKGLSQAGNQFSVTYHTSLADVSSYSATNNNAITASSITPVFAVVRNSVSTTCFSAPYQLDFVINKVPEPKLEDKIICVDNKTNLAQAGTTVTLDSALSLADHAFEWKDKNGIMLTELGSTLTTSIVGVYSVIATNTTTGCVSKSVSASVIPSSIAITGYTVTQNFEDNQTIVVIATGANDDFLYSLDGAPFVESNVFENLTDGNHVIIVRDKNGCGDAPPLNALIINYPKFFTPNGDSFNEYWNIIGLKNQINSKISIYDRTGKLLKQISPNSVGWDGTYNGVDMPSNDYWFVVRYLEDGIEKEFKSHFSMKR